MAIEKLKIPGEESTTNPSFASPNINTAPDVKTSQAVAGITPISSPTVRSPSPSAQTPTGAGAPQAPAASPIVSSAVSGVSGIPNTSPTVSSAKPASVVAPTPAPAAPASPPSLLPPTPISIEGKGATETERINAENRQKRELYEAALKYEGPEGELHQHGVKAERGLEGATANRGAAGTIESSLYGGDKTRIVEAKNEADALSHDTYQKAVADANEKWAEARAAYERANAREKREIEEAARKAEPTQPIGGSAIYPIPPAQQAAIDAGTPAGPGGVVPYEGGKVRVGMPQKKQRPGNGL